VIGDFFRFWWALLDLNYRQARFRRRGRIRRNPCQAPSDSGRAWETHCEAAQLWNRPERLRHVCPHLRRGPDGWRCAIDTAEIGPHWGRAAVWYGLLVATLYFAAGLGAFALFRFQGLRSLSPLDTLWPPRWTKVTSARSAEFLSEAGDSLGRGDLRTTRLNLASAANTAGDSYEVRLRVAQLNSYLSADEPATEAFRDLLRSFPAQRTHTAIVYHDVMIALRAFDALGDFAARQLADPAAPDRTVWLRVFFVALRGALDPVALHRRNAPQLAGLPALWRTTLANEAALRGGDVAAVTALLGLPVERREAALLTAAGESIADFAPAAQAVDEVVRLAPAIGVFDRERLLFRVQARLGSPPAALRAFDAMLRTASQPHLRERLLATLIEFPDPDRAARFHALVANSQAPFSLPELGAVWVAAVLARDDSLRRQAEQRLLAQHQAPMPSGLSLGVTPANTSLWIRTVPMGRESAWALSLLAAPSRLKSNHGTAGPRQR
jgi:hypothetical protein